MSDCTYGETCGESLKWFQILKNIDISYFLELPGHIYQLDILLTRGISTLRIHSFRGEMNVYREH